MKPRTQRAVIIAYLAMISIIAPVAFLIGNANNSNSGALLSQNGTDSRAPYSLLSTLDGCVLLGLNGMISRTRAEIDCLPLHDGQSRAGSRRKPAIGVAPKLQRTPLDNAFTTAIAMDMGNRRVGANQTASTITNPLSLALTPTITAQGGSRLGSPTTPFGGGWPNVLAPLIGLGNDGPLPPPNAPPMDDIPDLVTPLPAALPLMLTGFAGLFAATRRKCKVSNPS